MVFSFARRAIWRRHTLTSVCRDTLLFILSRFSQRVSWVNTFAVLVVNRSFPKMRSSGQRKRSKKLSSLGIASNVIIRIHILNSSACPVERRVHRGLLHLVLLLPFCRPLERMESVRRSRVIRGGWNRFVR
jgi:hypothetical protein